MMNHEDKPKRITRRSSGDYDFFQLNMYGHGSFDNGLIPLVDGGLFGSDSHKKEMTPTAVKQTKKVVNEKKQPVRKASLKKTTVNPKTPAKNTGRGKGKKVSTPHRPITPRKKKGEIVQSGDEDATSPSLALPDKAVILSQGTPTDNFDSSDDLPLVSVLTTPASKEEMTTRAKRQTRQEFIEKKAQQQALKIGSEAVKKSDSMDETREEIKETPKGKRASRSNSLPPLKTSNVKITPKSVITVVNKEKNELMVVEKATTLVKRGRGYAKRRPSLPPLKLITKKTPPKKTATPRTQSLAPPKKTPVSRKRKQPNSDTTVSKRGGKVKVISAPIAHPLISVLRSKERSRTPQRRVTFKEEPQDEEYEVSSQSSQASTIAKVVVVKPEPSTHLISVETEQVLALVETANRMAMVDGTDRVLDVMGKFTLALEKGVAKPEMSHLVDDIMKGLDNPIQLPQTALVPYLPNGKRRAQSMALPETLPFFSPINQTVPSVDVPSLIDTWSNYFPPNAVTGEPPRVKVKNEDTRMGGRAGDVLNIDDGLAKCRAVVSRNKKTFEGDNRDVRNIVEMETVREEIELTADMNTPENIEKLRKAGFVMRHEAPTIEILSDGEEEEDMNAEMDEEEENVNEDGFESGEGIMEDEEEEEGPIVEEPLDEDDDIQEISIQEYIPQDADIVEEHMDEEDDDVQEIQDDDQMIMMEEMDMDEVPCVAEVVEI